MRPAPDCPCRSCARLPQVRRSKRDRYRINQPELSPRGAGESAKGLALDWCRRGAGGRRSGRRRDARVWWIVRRDSLLCQHNQGDSRCYSPCHVHSLCCHDISPCSSETVDCYSSAVLIEVDSVRARICATVLALFAPLPRPRPVLTHPKFAPLELPVSYESYRRASRSRCEGN